MTLLLPGIGGQTDAPPLGRDQRSPGQIGPCRVESPESGNRRFQGLRQRRRCGGQSEAKVHLPLGQRQPGCSCVVRMNHACIPMPCARSGPTCERPSTEERNGRRAVRVGHAGCEAFPCCSPWAANRSGLFVRRKRRFACGGHLARFHSRNHIRSHSDGPPPGRHGQLQCHECGLGGQAAVTGLAPRQDRSKAPTPSATEIRQCHSELPRNREVSE